MKPPGAVFDRAWRARCAVVPCSVASLSEALRVHYIGKRPGVVTLAMMMLEDAFMVGAVVYALPPRETATRFGGVTWEMARLWIDDRVPTNGESWLIAQSVKHIRANYPDVRCLVTYADPSAGHTGTVYRAANWRKDGQTDDGRKSPRFDLADAVTGKKYGRRSHVPVGAATVRCPRVSKARFVYYMHQKATA